jgi:AcrR family transcriptional regulator
VIATRTVGRPRDPGVDRAILDAGLDELRESGFGAFSMDAVAVRAGVGKATIYRRWSGKEELILAAAETLVADVPFPDTGSVRGDLLALALGMAAKLTSETVGCLAAELAAESTRSPEARALLNRFAVARCTPVLAAVRRGIERGELRADVDPETVVDAVVGPVFYRTRISGAPVRRRTLERIVDLALEGARAR